MKKFVLPWKKVDAAMAAAFEEHYLDPKTGGISSPDPVKGKDGPGVGEVVIPKRPASVDYSWMIQFSDTVLDKDLRARLFEALRDPKSGMNNFLHEVASDPEGHAQWKKYRDFHAFKYVKQWIAALGIDCDFESEPTEPQRHRQPGKRDIDYDEQCLDSVLLATAQDAGKISFHELCLVLEQVVKNVELKKVLKSIIRDGWLTLSPPLHGPLHGKIKTMNENLNKDGDAVVVFTRKGEARLLDARLKVLKKKLDIAQKDPAFIEDFAEYLNNAGQEAACLFLDYLDAEEINRSMNVLAGIRLAPGTRTDAAMRRALSRVKKTGGN
ncbi:MAG: hypothetical protein GXP49_13840 [Deltaproteobacteria bacterium]|nr:hypothetical protein [Deltaproteobacteria bacterium]